MGIGATPNGDGYYEVASDGGIFAFPTLGGPPFEGSTGSIRLNKPIVGMSLNAAGQYYLVASDGGIFAFPTVGGAPFFGSTGSLKLVKPIVGMAAVSGGYYLTASDGGIFAFPTVGGPPFFGSTGGKRLAQPIVAISSLNAAQDPLWGSGCGAERHLVGPQLRADRHRAAVGRGPIGAGMAMGECWRRDPGLEGILVAPAGHDQPLSTVVGGPEQFETLEALLVVDRAGTGGEALASSSPASSGTVMALILITVGLSPEVMAPHRDTRDTRPHHLRSLRAPAFSTGRPPSGRRRGWSEQLLNIPERIGGPASHPA